MSLDFFHDLVRIPIEEVVRPALEAAVHVVHNRLQRNGGQFPQKRFSPDPTLYGLEANPINAGTASVGTDKMPSVSEYLCPADLVVERVKAIGRFLLGLGIHLPL